MGLAKENIEAMEITTFKLKGCTREEFISANADIDRWLTKQQGFQSRRIAQSGNGTIFDVLIWDSAAEATQSMHRLMDEMADSPVHGMIDQGSVTWNVYPVYHTINQ